MTAQLDDLAQVHNLSRSAVVAEQLERALRDRQETVGLDLIVPRLEEAIRRETARMSDRLAQLTRRTALEAATVRSLVYSELVHKTTAETAEVMHKAAYAAARERLKQPVQAWSEGDEHGRHQGG